MTPVDRKRLLAQLAWGEHPSQKKEPDGYTKVFQPKVEVVWTADTVDNSGAVSKLTPNTHLATKALLTAHADSKNPHRVRSNTKGQNPSAIWFARSRKPHLTEHQLHDDYTLTDVDLHVGVRDSAEGVKLAYVTKDIDIEMVSQLQTRRARRARRWEHGRWRSGARSICRSDPSTRLRTANLGDVNIRTTHEAHQTSDSLQR